MFDGRFRHAVDRSTAPVGRALVRLRVTANVLTLLGLCMSVGAAVAIAAGDFAWGLVLMVATGLPDLFDGPVAKASGTASVRGAFFDSVADRVADAFLYGGLAWYLAAHHHGTTAVVPFAILAATGLISYERAKAELLGVAAKGGLMERAERFIALGLCLLAAAVDPVALVPGLLLFLVLVLGTAAGRFVRVWQAAPAARTTSGAGAAAGKVPADQVGTDQIAAGGPAGPLPVSVRWRPGRVDSRWRAWRAARAHGPVPVVDGSGRRRQSAGAVPRPGLRRTGELSARWRARRAAVPASRVGRVWRDRRTGRTRPRTGRRSAAGQR